MYLSISYLIIHPSISIYLSSINLFDIQMKLSVFSYKSPTKTLSMDAKCHPFKIYSDYIFG